MRLLVPLVAAVLLLVAVAAASSRVFPEGPEPLQVAKGWALRRSERFDKSAEQREFIVAIKQQNLEQLEALFWAVSDPSSPQYGQHVTIDQLTELIAPTNEAVASVTSFLSEHGATELSLTMNRDFVRARASLAALERMFNVTFSTYRHRDAFEVPVRATVEAYSVPAEIAQHIDLVSHITGLPDVHLPRKAKFLAPGDLDITPSVIWARYNITGWTAKSSSNSQAVAEFQAQFYSQTDLTTFFQKFVPNSKADTVYKVVGPNNPARPGDEASLDIQYLMGVAPNVSTWFYSQAQFNFYNDLVNWLTILSNQTDAPWVHSVSYGSQGNYPSASYQSRSDAEYQKLGARGLTIVYASGDSGAQCEDRCKVLDPSYPAISTYVTSIGSTKFLTGNTGPEGATTSFKSGGGFSPFNARPSYQSTAVQNYLNQNIPFPPSGSFNSTGRGTPDFAALGDEHFQVIVGGRTFSIGGTSASAPTFSAIVSILNDYRLAAGKSTLGFVNPLFYQLAAGGNGAFYDVTVGDNKEGCGTSCAPKVNGFTCAPGWDAVSGYGTPNVSVLKSLVLQN